MIAGLDSSYFRPTVAQLTQARAAGVRVWGGYISTKPNVGIASPWDQASFERVRAVLGTTPIGWAGGWDDPVACRQKAAAWNVRLGLDDESGIRVGLSPLEEEHIKQRIANRGPRRVDGSWVQPWLDASGAGLYGNAPVFNGRHAPFFVIAAYPSSGDPGRTWPAGTALPAVPCGWQWRGTHDEFGGGVDRGNYDDWFAQGADDLTPEQDAILRKIYNFLRYGADGADGNAVVAGMPEMLGLSRNLFNFLRYGADGQRGDSVLKALPNRDELKSGLAGITVSIDESKLAELIAAKLPTGTATLDAASAAVLARSVVDEIGTRFRPPV